MHGPTSASPNLGIPVQELLSMALKLIGETLFNAGPNFRTPKKKPWIIPGNLPSYQPCIKIRIDVWYKSVERQILSHY